MPRQWKLFGALVLTGLLIALLATGPLSLAVYRLISIVENHYQEWFSQQDAANSIRTASSCLYPED